MMITEPVHLHRMLEKKISLPETATFIFCPQPQKITAALEGLVQIGKTGEQSRKKQQSFQTQKGFYFIPSFCEVRAQR